MKEMLPGSTNLKCIRVKTLKAFCLCLKKLFTYEKEDLFTFSIDIC